MEPDGFRYTLRREFHPPTRHDRLPVSEGELTYGAADRHLHGPNFHKHHQEAELDEYYAGDPTLSNLHVCVDCGFSSNDRSQFALVPYINEWDYEDIYDSKLVCRNYHRQSLDLSCGHTLPGSPEGNNSTNPAVLDWYPPAVCPVCGERALVSHYWIGLTPGEAEHRNVD